jgi:GT2 family glycosyltransferase
MDTINNIAITAPPGLVSIVIPCCGMLDYTKLCVPSVLRHSRAPFELIFLDIGSLDGTAEYLAGLHDGLYNRVRVEIVRAATDMHIAEAVGDALAAARGEFVCLLNNDTIVTTKWLDALTALAQLVPSHGMVGPMSNCAPEGQRVDTVPYRLGPRKGAKPGEPLIDVAAVEAFARDHHGEKRCKWMEIEALGGFCLLIRRDAMERIRPALAQWTDLSLFDTDIAGKKARQEGFQLVVCRDLYVHHFGTRTFAHGAPAAPDAVQVGAGR